MIISRTPFRVSFFGGGTDYPVRYEENGGAVLATTVDKYCYITCRYLPPFFEHKCRIIYSKMEMVKKIAEIEHPSVRECLRYLKINKGVEIHHDGDLPARTGLGSSSAFTVGLLHALYALKGVMPSKMQLALDAIHIEQEIIKESVGSQDQTLAAFGGFNWIEFGGGNHPSTSSGHRINVRPIILNSNRLESFQNHLMLFYTGLARFASEIAAEQIRVAGSKKKEISAMLQMAVAARDILNSHADLADFGKLLHENWQVKRSLSGRISTPVIDEIYDAALSAGALGGKLLGAGGGGFMLLFASPEVQPQIRKRLKKLLYVPFRFEDQGSQIIFYSPIEPTPYIHCRLS